MRRSLFFTYLLVVGVAAMSAVASAEPMQCRIGPVTKTYGGTEWTVSSCDDGESLVIVSAPGNPAMPFVFFVSVKDGKRSLRGEGAGSKEASSAAYEYLSELIETDKAVETLIAETVMANETNNE